MLATGGSAIRAVDNLLEAGVEEEKIYFLNLLSCPEGLDAFCGKYPKINIITSFVDEGLNEKKQIVPGLDDFGGATLSDLSHGNVC